MGKYFYRDKNRKTCFKSLKTGSYEKNKLNLLSKNDIIKYIFLKLDKIMTIIQYKNSFGGLF